MSHFYIYSCTTYKMKHVIYIQSKIATPIACNNSHAGYTQKILYVKVSL